MTLLRNNDISRDFIKNQKRSSLTPVLYEKENLNKSEVINLLRSLITNKIDKSKFCDYFGYNTEVASNKEFLFLLTHVTRLNLDFIEYCKLIKIFGEWNPQYRLNYRSDRMFKNMILKIRSGKNFPITSPDELQEKLRIFNRVSKLPVVTYLDILDVASKDLIKKQIRIDQYIQLIYLILKCVDKGFGREACRRVKNTFFKIGNKTRAHEFVELMNYR